MKIHWHFSSDQIKQDLNKFVYFSKIYDLEMNAIATMFAQVWTTDHQASTIPETDQSVSSIHKTVT